MITTNKKKTVLIVDDMPEVIDIMSNILNNHYTVIAAINGEIAIKIAKSQNKPDLIFLDIIMPKMDGFEVCRRLKMDNDTKEIPVVFITSDDKKEHVVKGLQLGAYYYLNKPIDPSTIITIAKAAIEDHLAARQLKDEIRKTTNSFKLIESGRFRFRTLPEAQQLAILISKACPSPKRQVVGLMELMINAIEHGNLGLDYVQKGDLKEKGIWENEVNRLQSLPEHFTKSVLVQLEKNSKQLTITITDEGSGFDWRPFLDFDPERMFDLHGRGIALANQQSFDRLEYQGVGNQVTVYMQF